MTDKEWEEFTRRAEKFDESQDVKTRDILDLLHQRDELKKALTRLVRACTPSPLPGEPARGVRMPEKAAVAVARTALDLVNSPRR